MNLNTKYRPSRFEDVVGQEDTISILKDEIKTNTLNSSYLFVGGSGQGKTSLARIFANEIDGQMIEIDAGSNSTAESMRNLLDSTKIKPINKQMWVIILDEVQCLSSMAWSVLLKSLEVFATHRIFILCTTEENKIPKTIYNRSEVCYFNKISKEDIIERLRYIYLQEHLAPSTPAEESLRMIATIAQGSVRQAVTYLDKIRTKEITVENIRKYLCAGTYDTYFNLLFAILDKNYEEIVKIIDSVDDIERFVAEFFSFILDCQLYIKTKRTDIPHEFMDDLKQIREEDYKTISAIMKELYNLQFLGRHNPILRELFIGMCYIILGG